MSHLGEVPAGDRAAFVAELHRVVADPGLDGTDFYTLSPAFESADLTREVEWLRHLPSGIGWAALERLLAARDT